MKVGVSAWMVLATGLVVGISHSDVVRNPMNFGIALEEFQLFKMNQYQGPNFDLPVTMFRPTGWIFQSASINDKVAFVFGLGATTFSLPRDSGQFPGSSSYKHELFPAVALVQASGSYAWGGLEQPVSKLTFGQMPYKYNADARDFGDYLFRSTPYPNTVLNSPFDLVNGAQASILGGIWNLNLAGGKWNNDLLITSATSTYPLYDFSLAYVTHFRINPILKFGAGVNLFRLIPVQSEVTTYKGDASNAYFTGANGKKYSTRSSYYTGSLDDSVQSDAGFKAISDKGALPAGVSDVNYYSLKGQMLMADFSIDFKPILGERADLMLYGEWAMLGVKDYPVFYEKPMERMPIMVGLHIPTWGLLDILCVEAEYWKNPYLNSTFGMSYGGLGTPDLNPISYAGAGAARINEPLTKDDLRWSVSATRSLGKSFSVTAKVAKDHLQVMQEMQAGFPGKSYGDVMSRKDSWYYVMRLQVAI